MNEYIRQLLLKRGYDSPEKMKKFLHPQISDLSDPFLIPNIDKIVDFILGKIKSGSKILIYGDYDVDGVTSIVILYSFFKKIKVKNLSYAVSNRFNEGYGISKNAILKAKEDKVDLIITVDCGIKDFDAITMAKKFGMSVIITDHHEVGGNIPDADFILNPKQYPDTFLNELSGCGVVFKLIQSLSKRMGFDFDFQMLNFVCLSTACDIVPLINENRVLICEGLKQLNKKIENIGLQTLFDISEIKKKIEINDLLFKIGPCINAAGRLESAKYTIDLFLTNDINDAKTLAKKIYDLNEERKNLCKKTFEEAKEMIEEEKNTNVLFNPEWHQGILGIIASRCVELNNRPTIIFTRRDDFLVGSARSTKKINLYYFLSQCSDTLLRFGGHTMAAGIVLEEKNLNIFKNKFEKVISESIKKQPIECLTSDLKFDLDCINDNFLEELRLMQPFGFGNENPIFESIGTCSKCEENEYRYTLIVTYKSKKIHAIIKKKNIDIKIAVDKKYVIFYNIIFTNNNFYLKILHLEETK